MRHEKVRFILVGAVNTSIDFIVLFALVDLFGAPTIVANIVSTTVAVAVSYVLNKKAVFGDTDTHNVTQIALFVVVTLTGLWVLQGIIIAVLAPWLQTFVGKNIALFGAKLVATVFSLTWNYLWYSRIVFKKKNV